MFEQGFFKPGVPLYSWEEPSPEFIDSVLDYAESVGLLAKESHIKYLPQTERGNYSWILTDPETGEIMVKVGFSTWDKAKTSAKAFAIRRAKYAGEHPLNLKIYDRSPDISNLGKGVIYEGQITIPMGKIRGTEKRLPAVIPAEAGPRRRQESDLEYLADSPEFLTQTVDATGYRGMLNTTFQEAIARAKGLTDIYKGFKEL
jgi:hypothetical protein